MVSLSYNCIFFVTLTKLINYYQIYEHQNWYFMKLEVNHNIKQDLINKKNNFMPISYFDA